MTRKYVNRNSIYIEKIYEKGYDPEMDCSIPVRNGLVQFGRKRGINFTFKMDVVTQHHITTIIKKNLPEIIGTYLLQEGFSRVKGKELLYHKEMVSGGVAVFIAELLNAQYKIEVFPL